MSDVLDFPPLARHPLAPRPSAPPLLEIDQLAVEFPVLGVR